MLSTALRFFATSLFSLALLGHAQSAATLAPPSLGPLVSYTYWPTQYVQWIGTELPFSMIELDVNRESKSPIFYVSLTERASGKRIHYTSADGLVAFAKAQHEEAYKTEIAFESDDTEAVGSTSTLRLTMADGKPLQWRFTQGSDISEQGSGLTPLPEAPNPIFIYREQGGVAGEGTALQIGNVVSTADVWKEISHPPQFIAYRGAVTKSAHSLLFLPGKETWSSTSAPAALTPGLGWELDSASGNHRTMRIDKVNGAHVTLTISDRFQPSIRMYVDATYSAGSWTLERIRYAPVHDGEKHFAQLSYTPGISEQAGESGMALAFSKAKAVASGTVKLTSSGAEQNLAVSFADPSWLRGKTLLETVTRTADGITTISHP